MKVVGPFAVLKAAIVCGSRARWVPIHLQAGSQAGPSLYQPSSVPIIDQ